MPCLITVLTGSAIRKTTRTKNNKISKNKEFLEAPSNNVKMQSDKTLTTQIKFLLTMQQMDVFLNETR